MKEQNPFVSYLKTLMAIWVNHCSGYHYFVGKFKWFISTIIHWTFS